MILKHLWKSVLAATALVFYCMLPVDAQSNDAGILIDQVIEAYGGRQNVFSVKSYRMEAAIETHVQGDSGKVTRISEGPLQLKVLIRYDDLCRPVAM